MKNHNLDFKAVGEKIQEILYEYVKIESYTNTDGERLVEDFFTERFGRIPYFSRTPGTGDCTPWKATALKDMSAGPWYAAGVTRLFAWCTIMTS